VSIFLELIDLPIDDMARFVSIADDIQHGTPEIVTDAIRRLRDLMAEEIAKRRAAPGEDLFSQILKRGIEGREISPDEMMGMSFNLFLGGLDTVRSTLGYVFRYLASNVEHQAKLRQDPSLIADAVEELIRAHPVVTTGRRVVRDVEFAGVFLKAGDNIALSTSLASRDPEEFDQPDEIDFLRSPNRHSVFGFGPHRCLGSHLARRELTSAVEAWMRYMPPFTLASNEPPQSAGPAVVGLKALRLRWED
jgi:cytochrome P450